MYMRGFILPCELDKNGECNEIFVWITRRTQSNGRLELNLFKKIANMAIKYEHALFFSEPGIRFSFPADANLYC